MTELKFVSLNGRGCLGQKRDDPEEIPPLVDSRRTQVDPNTTGLTLITVFKDYRCQISPSRPSNFHVILILK